MKRFGHDTMDEDDKTEIKRTGVIKLINDIVRLKKQNFSWNQIAKRLHLPKELIKQQWRFYLMDIHNQSKENEIFAVLTATDRMYCSWCFHESVLDAAFYCVKPLNKEILDLRIFDVTDLYFDGTNAHSVTCIKVKKDEQSWTIKNLKKNRSYLCELGYITKEYFFFPLLQSNPIQTPYADSSDYTLKQKDAEKVYYDSLPYSFWIEHPDCSIKN